MKWPHSIGDDFNAKKPSTNNLSEKVKPFVKRRTAFNYKILLPECVVSPKIGCKMNREMDISSCTSSCYQSTSVLCEVMFQTNHNAKSDTCLSMTFRLGLSLNTCDSPGLVSKWVRYDWGATRGHYELLNWMESLLGNTSHNHTRQSLHKQKPSGHNLKVHNTQWTQIPQKTEPS